MKVLVEFKGSLSDIFVEFVVLMENNYIIFRLIMVVDFVIVGDFWLVVVV